jgi:phospholipid-binding lipoprotein MlaA
MPEKQISNNSAFHSTDTIKSDETYAIDVYDPLERLNRRVYRFNAGFDKYIFLPTTRTYEAITPDLVEDGISNFINNVFEVTNFTNAVLQLKPKAAVKTSGRFLINTTMGIGGLFDVASKMGITEQEEDFGQTLGRYGVGNGAYLVLPILGPSNLRDSTGSIADSITFSKIDLLNLDEHSKRKLMFYLTNAIDTRHNIDFRYYDTGSPFEYELIRLLYTKKRQLDIAR